MDTGRKTAGFKREIEAVSDFFFSKERSRDSWRCGSREQHDEGTKIVENSWAKFQTVRLFSYIHLEISVTLTIKFLLFC